MDGRDLLPGIEQGSPLLEIAQGRPGQQAVPVGEAVRRPALVVIFQAAELVVPGGKAQLLIAQGGKIPAQGHGPAGGPLIQGPDVVGVQNVEHVKQLVVRGGVKALAAEGQDVVQVDALPQPDGPGAHPFHRLPGLAPERHRHGAGHVAAEAVHILGPIAQGLDLIIPQAGNGVVQIHHIGPVPHLVAPAAVGLAIVILRVQGHQGGVRGGVVIHHVDDALHAIIVNGVHQVEEVLQGAVLRVHRAIVPVGIGAAHAALAVGFPDGVDGHQPQDVRAQGPDPGQIRLHGPEGALGRVAADVQLIDHAAAQGGIGFKGHGKYLPENYLRLSKNSEIFRHRKGR